MVLKGDIMFSALKGQDNMEKEVDCECSDVIQLGHTKHSMRDD